jgi:activator of HSP90 ATPase
VHANRGRLELQLATRSQAEDDDALNTKTNFEVPKFGVDVTDIDPM